MLHESAHIFVLYVKSCFKKVFSTFPYVKVKIGTTKLV